MQKIISLPHLIECRNRVPGGPILICMASRPLRPKKPGTERPLRKPRHFAGGFVDAARLFGRAAFFASSIQMDQEHARNKIR